VPSDLFGVCIAASGGELYAVGDADHEFTLVNPLTRERVVDPLVCHCELAQQPGLDLFVSQPQA